MELVINTGENNLPYNFFIMTEEVNIKIIIDGVAYHRAKASFIGCEECDLLQYCSEHKNIAITCDSISETDIWKRDDNN